MRPVILGGSFNPPHLGHLFLAEQALCQGGFDQVILVPSYKPAHKDDDDMAPAEDRLAMVERAVDGLPGWQVEACEIRRRGISYTIDTVRYLRESLGLAEPPGVLLGDDLVPGFDQWKEAGRLAAEAELILARRGEAPSFEYPHRTIRNRPLELSSTEIRERIRTGQAWRWLVAPGTADWIEKKGLYRPAGGGTAGGGRLE